MPVFVEASDHDQGEGTQELGERLLDRRLHEVRAEPGGLRANAGALLDEALSVVKGRVVDCHRTKPSNASTRASQARTDG
jgi:hypothetical protein